MLPKWLAADVIRRPTPCSVASPAVSKTYRCKQKINQVEYEDNWVVPRLRSLVADLSPRKPVFAPGSIHVGFVVDKVAVGQVFLRVLRFPLSISSIVIFI
jgi:hypothetical protein